MSFSNKEEKGMAFENTVWGRIALISTRHHGVALRFRGKEFSYDYLKDQVDKYASRLYNLGIRKDDVVCIAAPNIPSSIFAMYAVNSIGAINFIVHPLIPAKALEEDLKKTKAKLLLVLDQRYSIYKGIKQCPIYTISPKNELSPIEDFFYPIAYASKLKGSKGHDLTSVPFTKEPIERNTDEYKPSFYLQSGGTTGKSKIVVLNDRAVNYQGENVAWILGDQYRYCKGSGMLGFLPMFHGFGLAMGVHAPLTNYATSDLMATYNEKEIGKLIKARKLRYLIVVPYLAKRMLKGKTLNDPSVSNLTHAFIGADKTNPTVFTEFDSIMEKNNSKCRLLEGYGLTETVTVVVVNRIFDRKPGSVCKPFPDVKLKVIDENGNTLSTNQNGQICISAPCLALGYLNDKEATDKTFVTDENGIRWVLTGDEGYIDEDGFLFIKGRIKDMFKIAGFNIFPADIEDMTNKIEGVENCAAVYIDNPNHPYVHLFIKSDSKNIDTSELVKRVRKNLSNELIKYAIPEKITVIDKLPLTNVGKINKKKLIELD